MVKLFRFFLVGTLFLAAGCFDYEEHLVLNKDGSGSVEMSYRIYKSDLEQMQQMAEMMSGEKQSMEELAKDMSPMSEFENIDDTALPPGVKVVYVKSSETDDAFVYNMKFTFDNLNALGQFWGSMSESSEGSEMGAPGQPIPEVTFVKQQDGTYLFTRLLESGSEAEETGSEYSSPPPSYTDEEEVEQPQAEETPPPSPPSAEEMAEGMEQLGEAMEAFSQQVEKATEQAGKRTIRFSVKFPGEVVKSNATKVEGDVAIWEYPFDKLMSAPPKMTATIK
jgi:hypothetical protein